MDQQQTTGLSQENRILRLVFPNQDGPKKPLFANTLDAYEGLSQDFRFVVEAISEDASIQLKEVMGKLITIELVRTDGSIRHFNGHVFEFRHTRSDGGFAYYDIVLLPWLAYLHVRTNNYLFHDQTTRQALEKIFGDYAGKKFEFRIPTGKTHTFRAQWRETDHNYVHRRLEEEGLYYWYEHSASGHTLIISDDSQQAPLIDGDNSDVTYALNATGEEQDSMVSWVPVRQIASGKVSLTSFDFKQPKPMEASRDTRNNQGQVADYEIYEYTGEFGFVDKAQGEAIAKRHMEEIEGLGKHFEFAGNCRWLQPGRWFLLAGHYELDQEEEFQRRFLISEVRHSASNNYLQKGGLPQYTNTGSGQRKYIPFRPGRGYNSEQPRIYGIQSAIVVGPAGEEIFCDQYGRVRVQFHWDREGKYDDKSSCWIRVASTWAGSNFGAMSVPRIGQEVLVQWLDGDPDLPIITGRVYNEANKPPWDLPANQTQTGILTRSSKGGAYANANAVRFEDKKGEEQLWLHAEKDQLTEVEHDEDKWVGNDRRKTIDRDETNHIQRDRTETVDRDETITVHGKRTEVVDGNEDITIHSNRTERVDQNETIDIGDNRSRTVGSNESVDIGSNQSVTVGSSKTETVAIAKALTVGAGYAVTVGGAMNTAVGLAQFEEVGLNKSVMVGKTFSITAGDELSITVGEAKLLMKKDGTIELTGTKIKVAASPGPTDIFGTNVNLNPKPPAPAPGKTEGNGGAPAAAAPAADGGAPVKTGLGDDVDQLAAKSPSLQKDLEKLKKDKWEIEYGEAGGGSYANRDSTPPKITIDGAEKGNPTAVTQTLAHEAGHATYTYTPDYSSKAAYLKGPLGDEGAATLNNIKVQREILANGGSDIGIAGNSANQAAYNNAYDLYLKDGNAGSARDAIGSIFGKGEITSTTGQPYADYYGGWYDKAYPAKNSTVPRRRLLLGFVGMALIGYRETFGHEKKGIEMKELQFDLWELISTLEQKMPLSVENTEIILDRKLHEEKKTDHYVLLSCAKAPLKDGVFVLPRLMLAPNRQFDLTSALAIELDGGCISRTEIEKHFGELSLTQVPRGRSLEETAVWTAKRPWGFLSFAFKERSPDCLFSVSFRRKIA